MLKDVFGYEGYYKISDDGRLYSVDREIVKSNGVLQPRKGKEISLHKNKDGYLMAKLCRGGKYTTAKIHRIVAEAFIRKIEDGEEVNHINFDRSDNRVSNLEICTHRENVYYAINANRHISRTGGNSGSKNPKSRKVKILENGLIFSFIGECALWLMDNHYTKGTLDNARHEIIKCINGKKESYRGLHFVEFF